MSGICRGATAVRCFSSRGGVGQPVQEPSGGINGGVRSSRDEECPFPIRQMGTTSLKHRIGQGGAGRQSARSHSIALKYNLGVEILLPERLFPPRFVTIASSNFDDTVEHPIDRNSLAKLQDPSLTTEEFHRIYHQLTWPPKEIQRRY